MTDDVYREGNTLQLGTDSPIRPKANHHKTLQSPQSPDLDKNEVLVFGENNPDDSCFGDKGLLKLLEQDSDSPPVMPCVKILKAQPSQTKPFDIGLVKIKEGDKSAAGDTLGIDNSGNIIRSLKHIEIHAPSKSQGRSGHELTSPTASHGHHKRSEHHVESKDLQVPEKDKPKHSSSRNIPVGSS